MAENFKNDFYPGDAKGTIPRPFVQFYENYDRAVWHKVREVVYHTQDENGQDSAKPIFVVFASPERAFAQVAKQLARQRGIDKVTDQDIKNVPLPIVSINRLPPKFDPKRYQHCTLKNLYYCAERQEWYKTKRPNPYDIQYQIDLWARNIGTMDDLMNQILSWFDSNYFYLKVEHPFPFGDRIVFTQLNDVADSSKLEDEKDQRAIRRTISMTVSGWLCFPAESHSIVEKVVTEVYDAHVDPADLMETFTVPEPVA